MVGGSRTYARGEKSQAIVRAIIAAAKINAESAESLTHRPSSSRHPWHFAFHKKIAIPHRPSAPYVCRLPDRRVLASHLRTPSTQPRFGGALSRNSGRLAHAVALLGRDYPKSVTEPWLIRRRPLLFQAAPLNPRHHPCLRPGGTHRSLQNTGPPRSPPAWRAARTHFDCPRPI